MKEAAEKLWERCKDMAKARAIGLHRLLTFTHDKEEEAIKNKFNLDKDSLKKYDLEKKYKKWNQMSKLSMRQLLITQTPTTKRKDKQHAGKYQMAQQKELVQASYVEKEQLTLEEARKDCLPK